MAGSDFLMIACRCLATHVCVSDGTHGNEDHEGHQSSCRLLPSERRPIGLAAFSVR